MNSDWVMSTGAASAPRLSASTLHSLRKTAFEDFVQGLLLVFFELGFLDLFLDNESVYAVGIHPRELHILELALKHIHKIGVEMAVQQKHVIALVLCGFDIGVLVLCICGIEDYEFLVLVGLVALDALARERGKVQKILLRITPGIDPHTHR